ncbi:MAG: hypothetical protein KKA05_05550, partial [Alphaproteobacteria bacterium]|nr:hypothetical protein [Alphaproteobacteria bacterium]
FKIAVGHDMQAMDDRLFKFQYAIGFHAPTIRTLFMAEYSRPSPDESWIKSKKPKATIAHEAGHFIDSSVLGVNGLYYSETKTFTSHVCTEISEVDEDRFCAAYETHFGALEGPNAEDLYEHMKDNFLNPTCGPTECFAELWSRCGTSAPRARLLADLLPAATTHVDRLHEKLLKGWSP